MSTLAADKLSYRLQGGFTCLQSTVIWQPSLPPSVGQWLHAYQTTYGRQSSFSYWSLQSELKSQDVRSAKLLQLSGTICRSSHILLRHTNNSDLRRRNIFTNWLLQTDHVTVSAPTICFLFLTTHGALPNTYNNNNDNNTFIIIIIHINRICTAVRLGSSEIGDHLSVYHLSN